MNVRPHGHFTLPLPTFSSVLVGFLPHLGQGPFGHICGGLAVGLHITGGFVVPATSNTKHVCASASLTPRSRCHSATEPAALRLIWRRCHLEECTTARQGDCRLPDRRRRQDIPRRLPAQVRPAELVRTQRRRGSAVCFRTGAPVLDWEGYSNFPPYLRFYNSYS